MADKSFYESSTFDKVVSSLSDILAPLEHVRFLDEPRSYQEDVYVIRVTAPHEVSFTMCYAGDGVAYLYPLRNSMNVTPVKVNLSGPHSAILRCFDLFFRVSLPVTKATS